MTNYFPDSKKLITELNNHSLTRCYIYIKSNQKVLFKVGTFYNKTLLYIRIKIPLFDNYEIISHIYELYIISTILSFSACVGSGVKQFWSKYVC